MVSVYSTVWASITILHAEPQKLYSLTAKKELFELGISWGKNKY